jgi:hypothetical protein
MISSHGSMPGRPISEECAWWAGGREDGAGVVDDGTGLVSRVPGCGRFGAGPAGTVLAGADPDEAELDGAGLAAGPGRVSRSPA